MNNYTLLRQLVKIWLDFMHQNSEDQKTRSWIVLQRKEGALGFSQQLKDLTGIKMCDHLCSLEARVCELGQAAS